MSVYPVNIRIKILQSFVEFMLIKQEMHSLSTRFLQLNSSLSVLSASLKISLILEKI